MRHQLNKLNLFLACFLAMIFLQGCENNTQYNFTVRIDQPTVAKGGAVKIDWNLWPAFLVNALELDIRDANNNQIFANKYLAVSGSALIEPTMSGQYTVNARVRANYFKNKSLPAKFFNVDLIDNANLSDITIPNAALRVCVENSGAITVAELTTLDCHNADLTPLADSGIKYLHHLKSLNIDDANLTYQDIQWLIDKEKTALPDLKSISIKNATELCSQAQDLFAARADLAVDYVTETCGETKALTSAQLGSMADYCSFLPIIYYEPIRYGFSHEVGEITCELNEGQSIGSLQSLEFFSHLTSFTLRDSSPTCYDLSPLGDKTGLFELELNACITDYTGIENLNSLRILKLNQFSAADLSFIAPEAPLRELTITDGTNPDLGALVLLADTLGKLNLVNNRLESLPDLSSMTYVKVMDLSNNQLNPAIDLQLPANVSDLDLTENHLTTLADLNNLTKLQVLKLSNNNIIDLQLLSDKIPRVTNINLSSNGLTNITGIENLIAPLYSSVSINLENNDIQQGIESLITIANFYTKIRDFYLNMAGNNNILCTDLDNLKQTDALIRTEPAGCRM